MTIININLQTGDDANDGVAAAHKTPIGMRTADNTAELTHNLAALPSGKLEPGDVLRFQDGGTLDSSIGGRMVVDSTRFNTTQDSDYIYIELDVNATQDLVIDLAGVTIPAFNAGWLFDSTAHNVRLVSRSANFIIIIKNSPRANLIAQGQDKNNFLHGFKLSKVQCNSAAIHGALFAYLFGFEFNQCQFNDNFEAGCLIGAASDRTCSGVTTDCVANNNGVTTSGPSGLNHGMITHSSSVIHNNLTTNGNGRDGADGGQVSNSQTLEADRCTIVYNNITSLDNGEDGIGTNGGGSMTTTFINGGYIARNLNSGVITYNAAATFITGGCIFYKNYRSIYAYAQDGVPTSGAGRPGKLVIGDIISAFPTNAHIFRWQEDTFVTKQIVDSNGQAVYMDSAGSKRFIRGGNVIVSLDGAAAAGRSEFVAGDMIIISAESTTDAVRTVDLIASPHKFSIQGVDQTTGTVQVHLTRQLTDGSIERAMDLGWFTADIQPDSSVTLTTDHGLVRDGVKLGLTLKSSTNLIGSDNI